MGSLRTAAVSPTPLLPLPRGGGGEGKKTEKKPKEKNNKKKNKIARYTVGPTSSVHTTRGGLGHKLQKLRLCHSRVTHEANIDIAWGGGE